MLKRFVLALLSLALVAVSLALPSPAAAGVVVTDVGRGAVAPLRYQWKVGPGPVQAMAMSIGMKLVMGGAEGTSVPPVRFDLQTSASIEAVDDAGTADLRQRIDSISVPAEPNAPPERLTQIAELSAKLETLKGLVLQMQVSALGEIRNARFDGGSSAIAAADAQILEQLRSTIEQSIITLPEEAVGVGAKWTKSVDIQIPPGIQSTQVQEVTLSKRKGTRIDIQVGTRASAAKGSIEVPGMPGGAGATLERLEAKGRGVAAIDLGTGTVIQQWGNAESALDMAVAMGEGSLALSVTTYIRVGTSTTPELAEAAWKKARP